MAETITGVRDGEVRIQPAQKTLRDGEPCSHTGCLRHISHPCEGCGRVAGIARKIHVLKCWPREYRAIVRGEKRHELRKNDRNYRQGDILVLQEFDPTVVQPSGTCFTDNDDPLDQCLKGQYTGEMVAVTVTHITFGGSFGLPDDHCVMSIQLFSPEHLQPAQWKAETVPVLTVPLKESDDPHWSYDPKSKKITPLNDTAKIADLTLELSAHKGAMEMFTTTAKRQMEDSYLLGVTHVIEEAIKAFQKEGISQPASVILEDIRSYLRKRTCIPTP